MPAQVFTGIKMIITVEQRKKLKDFTWEMENKTGDYDHHGQAL